MDKTAFFQPSRSLSVGEVAQITGAILRTPSLAERCIERLSSIGSALPGTLVFVDSKTYRPEFSSCAAAAVLCRAEIAAGFPSSVAVLETLHPKKDFFTIAALLFEDTIRASCLGKEGISPQCYIDDTAFLEENVTVEAGAFIGKYVQIGAGTTIGAGSVIGAHCRIGRRCCIGPSVTVQYSLLGDGVLVHPGARLGQDGFGYMAVAEGVEKLTQIGRVIIQDNVEIGANTTIDRGALEDTIIGEGTKIDNLVQIAHNVKIGRFCLIASHSGIAGSVVVGDRCVFGGRVGIKDHVTIGAGAQLAASAGLMDNVPAGQIWGGIPARPIKQWFREVALLRGLTKNKKSGPRNEK